MDAQTEHVKQMHVLELVVQIFAKAALLLNSTGNAWLVFANTQINHALTDVQVVHAILHL
jgi:hypothetical protein